MKERQAFGQGSKLHVWEENEACVEHGTRKILNPRKGSCAVSTQAWVNTEEVRRFLLCGNKYFSNTEMF